MAKEALEWAKQKSASMDLSDIALRIGGEFSENTITLPYFNDQLFITKDDITTKSGHELTQNEQTFIHIHMAQGGISKPTGNMKSFKEFPNTVSKIVSMKSHVEEPLQKAFSSNQGKIPGTG